MAWYCGSNATVAGGGTLGPKALCVPVCSKTWLPCLRTVRQGSGQHDWQWGVKRNHQCSRLLPAMSAEVSVQRYFCCIMAAALRQQRRVEVSSMVVERGESCAFNSCLMHVNVWLLGCDWFATMRFVQKVASGGPIN